MFCLGHGRFQFLQTLQMHVEGSAGVGEGFGDVSPLVIMSGMSRKLTV